MTTPVPNADDRIGICRACREWTSLREPCCNAPVLIEGAWMSPIESDDESDTAPVVLP